MKFCCECKAGWDIGAILVTYEKSNGQGLEGTVQKPSLSESQQSPAECIHLNFFSKVHFLLHVECEAHALWTPL